MPDEISDVPSPSEEIDARIEALGDWRGEVLARVRRWIREAEPRMVEAVKWRKPSNGMAGVPVWERAGIVCTGEVYKGHVKLTFPRGASLPDPAGLFNAGQGGGTRRAIDIEERVVLDEVAFKTLVRAAVAANAAAPPTRGGRTAPGRA